MRYTKPPLTYAQQIALLQRRGLVIADKAAAEQSLARLNYYRISAYSYPFYTDIANHRFRDGTRFEDILSLYEFDRRLRLRVMDAIERFEIALRTQFAYQLSMRHHGWAYEDVTLFTDVQRHTSRLNSLDRELKRSQETFIQHYRNHYGDPQRPPIWIACEVISLGLLSGLLDNLKQRPDRQAIARLFQLDERVLCSFAHHATTIRNICAHHGRLWNRHFTVTTKLPRKADGKLLHTLNPSAPRQIYNTLSLLAWLLNTISNDSRWAGQVIELIDEYPIVATEDMGFPPDWHERPLWQCANTNNKEPD